MQALRPLDRVTIAASGSLTPDDMRVLNLLYSPIVSKEAITVYFTMHNLLDKNNLTLRAKHKTFCDLLSISIQKFEENRQKLEAIGLLNSYYNGVEYLYTLRMPVTAKQFFLDGILASVLYSIVGKEEYERIQKAFTIESIDKTGYQEISKSFDEVFSIPNNLESPKKAPYYKDHKRNTGIVLQNNFSEETILQVYAEYEKYIEPDSYIRSRMKDSMISLAFSYSLNGNQLREILSSIVEKKGTISDPNELKEAVLSRESLEIKQKKNEASVGNDLYSTIKSCTMEDIFLFMLSRAPLAKEKDVLSKLQYETSYDIEVLKVLIFSVLNRKQALPGYEYLKKVCADWTQKGIYTLEDAVEYVTKEEVSTTTRSKKKNKKLTQEEDPSWLRDAMKDLENGDKL